MDLVEHQAIGHSAEAKQCPIVRCRGRHPGPTPPPPPFRAHQVRRLRGRGVLAAVAAWAVAGSRWPCWWWVVRGCRRCCVWCGRRRGPTSCVPARVWMARGATPQAHVFIYGELCQFTGGFRALAMDLHPSMAEASNHKTKSHAKSPLSAVHKLCPNHVKAMPKPT
eukprot:scaffold11561_cov72-Phaeocystis_antarctica.AAC.5